MIAALEGPAFDPTTDPVPALPDRLIAAVARFPFASITEIDAYGTRRSVLLRQLWAQAGAIAQELERRSVDPERPLILCFERTQDLIAAAWAAVLLERDAYLWQIQLEGSTGNERARRSERIRASLKGGILITRYALANQLQPPPVDGDPLFIDQLPIPGKPDWTVTAAGRKASFFLDTSGTTGLPKIGVLSHRALSERNHLLPAPDPTISRLSMLSFDSITGLGSLLPARNRLVLLHPLQFTKHPWNYLQMAADYQVENFVLSSSFAAHLIQQKERPPLEGKLIALKSVAFGLEQIVSETIWSVMELLDTLAGHPVKLGIGYGMTETGLLTATEVAPPAALLAPRGSGKAVAVGTCTRGKRIRILDESGSPVDCGEVGGIHVQVDVGLLSGYLQTNGSIAPLELRDGWFPTGDLGTIENNQLTILGRSKALIIHGGRNIPLASIDLALHQVAGLDGKPVAAINLPDPITHTDRLVVAYACDGKRDPALESTLMQAAGSAAKMPVAAICPLRSGDFPYTTSGKLRRNLLTERALGVLGADSSPRERIGAANQSDRPQSKTKTGPDALEASLRKLWEATLPREQSIHSGTHFFEAGGDSMEASVMLAKVENRFHKRVPLSAFYPNPTLGGLVAVLQQAAPLEPDFGLAAHTRLLQLQREMLKSWPGTAPFPDSLVRCFNPKGRQTPLIWVFQDGAEAKALAKALGRAVSLLAFRSWHQLIEISDLDTPLVESLADQMLLDVLALVPSGPIVVGGNCQGGLPALTLARKLSRLGHTPRQLILSEWSFAARAYPQPVHLIYGSESPVAEAFEAEKGAGWRELFPNATTERLVVAHGQFFQPGNVEKMAAAVRPFLKRSFWAKLRG